MQLFSQLKSSIRDVLSPDASESGLSQFLFLSLCLCVYGNAWLGYLVIFHTLPELHLGGGGGGEGIYSLDIISSSLGVEANILCSNKWGVAPLPPSVQNTNFVLSNVENTNFVTPLRTVFK